MGLEIVGMTDIMKQLLEDYSEERIKYCVEACHGVGDPKALINMSNEMLEALEIMRDTFLTGSRPITDDDISIISKAIAKARGEE